jgi:hypothetical protein
MGRVETGRPSSIYTGAQSTVPLRDKVAINTTENL